MTDRTQDLRPAQHPVASAVVTVVEGLVMLAFFAAVGVWCLAGSGRI